MPIKFHTIEGLLVVELADSCITIELKLRDTGQRAILKGYSRKMQAEGGRYVSQGLKDFWIKPEWLWRKNLPSVHAVLKKVGGKAYEDYLARQTEEEL